VQRNTHFHWLEHYLPFLIPPHVSPQGQYVAMACSRLGSRVLEAIWNGSLVSHRQNIAQELGNTDLKRRLFEIHGGKKICFARCSHPVSPSSVQWKPAEVGSVRSPCVGQVRPLPLHPQKSQLAGNPERRDQEAKALQWHSCIKTKYLYHMFFAM